MFGTISIVSTVANPKGLRLEEIEGFEVWRGTVLVKRGFAHMQKHCVIMDVTSVEQAQIAEKAGAVAVMVLDKLPYDVQDAGGVTRTASLKAIEKIMDHVTIPVMAKCRIGHTYEAKVLEAIGVDMIDESEVLTPADEERHIWKWDFTTPFVCGATSFYEWLSLSTITHDKKVEHKAKKPKATPRIILAIRNDLFSCATAKGFRASMRTS